MSLEPVDIEIRLRQNVSEEAPRATQATSNLSESTRDAKGEIERLEKVVNNLNIALEEQRKQTAILTGSQDDYLEKINSLEISLREANRDLDIYRRILDQTNRVTQEGTDASVRLAQAQGMISETENNLIDTTREMARNQDDITESLEEAAESSDEYSASSHILEGAIKEVASALGIENPLILKSIGNVKAIDAAKKGWTASTKALSIAQKALVVTGIMAVVAAIGTAIYFIKKWYDEQSKASQEAKKFNELVGNSVTELRVKYEKLRAEWIAAQGDLKKKEELVRKNIDAYNSFGIKINDVNDADRMFINNADAFRNAIMNRAMATAAMEIAAEKYKEYLNKMAEAERRFINPSVGESAWDALSSAGSGIVQGIPSFIGSGNWYSKSAAQFAKDAQTDMENEAEKANKEAQQWIMKALGFDKQTQNILKATGGQLTDEIIQGSKQHWQNIRDARQKTMDASLPDSGTFKTAKKERDQADKMLEAWNKTNSKSQESAALKGIKKQQAIADQEVKNQELIDKQKIESQRRQEDIDNQLVQSRIDNLADGAEKVRAQQELDNYLELQAIERAKEDYVKAVIQAEKEKFEANEELELKKNPKYIKKKFDPASVSVNTSDYDLLYNNAREKQIQDSLKAEQQAWNEYFLKFGNFQQKRKAIIEKYNQEIATAQTDGEKAFLEKEKQNELDELDNSIKNSTTLMGQLFADASRKSVTEISKIIDKAELLMQYLQSTKDEQGNATIGGKSVSKQDVLDLGVSENTLQNLELSTEQVESLRNAINGLKGDLGNRSPFMLFEKQMSDAINKINQGGKKNIAQGISEIGGATQQFSGDISKFGKDIANIIGADDDLAKKIDGVATGLDGMGEAAQGVGQIMAGDVVGGTMAVVSGVSKVVDALDTLFSGNNEISQKTLDHYAQLIAATDDLINKQKELLSSSAGSVAVNEAMKASATVQKQIDATRKLGSDNLNSGAGWRTSSRGVRLEKDLKGYRDQINAIGIDYDSLGGRMTGLFDLTTQQIEDLKYKAPEAWAALDEGTRGYLQTLIDTGEELKEIQNTLYEALTGMSFDEVRNSLNDWLLDAEMTSEKVADNIEDNFRKAIANVVGEKQKAALQKWYADFAKAMEDDKLTEDEKIRLQADYQAIYKDATKMRDEMLALADIELETSERTGASKGIVTASQDDIGELNGGVYAVRQMVGDMRNNQLEQINLQRESLLLTHAMSNQFDEITYHTSFLIKISKGIDDIKTYGVKMK